MSTNNILYIHFNCLEEPVAIVQSNLAFEIFLYDAIYKPLDHLPSTMSYHTYFGVSYNKVEKHQHLWNLSVISPILLLMITIPCIYAGVDDLKVVLNSRQQHLHT
jgi:hypothetical protein